MMIDNLYKFKLVMYGKSEGLKHAKRFAPNGAIKKSIIEKLDKESEFYILLTPHETKDYIALREDNDF